MNRAIRRACCLGLIVVTVGLGWAAAQAPLDAAALDVTKPPFNALGDGVTDNTRAFQDALHQAGESPTGGKVFVPRGRFLISGNLRFRPNVTLEGVSDFPMNSPAFWSPAGTPESLAGSVLLITAGEGQPGADPFIALHANCALKGLTFYYPNQIKANPPKPYPWTIAVTEGGADHCTLLDLLMVNPYQAVNFGRAGSGRHFIRNLYAYPLFRGLFVDQCYDIGRIENVHFWPFWGYAGDEDPLGRFVSENAEAFIFGRTDWQYVNNCFAIFYKVGFHFIKTNAGVPNVLLTQSGSDIGPYAVLVDDCQAHAGISFSNSQLFGRVKIAETNAGPVRFTGCGFFGATREKEPQEPVHFDIAGNGHVSINNCHFITLDPLNTAQTNIRAAGGGLSVMNSLFMDSGRVHCDLKPGLRSAILCGNTFRGTQNILNASQAKVQIGLNADETPPSEPGAIIIDNTSPGGAFSTEGVWRLGKAGAEYMGTVVWAQKGDGSAKALWRPDLPAPGIYAVHVWYGADPNADHATDAPFVVLHKAGEQTFSVNQREQSGQWVLLGVFEFDAGNHGCVMLHNRANGNVVADAVKFVSQ